MRVVVLLLCLKQSSVFSIFCMCVCIYIYICNIQFSFHVCVFTFLLSQQSSHVTGKITFIEPFEQWCVNVGAVITDKNLHAFMLSALISHFLLVLGTVSSYEGLYFTQGVSVLTHLASPSFLLTKQTVIHQFPRACLSLYSTNPTRATEGNVKLKHIFKKHIKKNVKYGSVFLFFDLKPLRLHLDLFGNVLQWLLTVFASLFPFSFCPPPCLSTGQHCTEDVNECRLQPNTCQNGGTCSNLIGSYQCVCVNGWSGADCSENIDDCATAACSPGSTCIDRVASFVCLCPHGKTGKPVVANHMQIFLHQMLELHKVDDCITRYNVGYCEIVNIWKQNWKIVAKKELNMIHVKQSETLIILQSII